MENTTDHTSGNAPLRFYRNNIDPNGTVFDAYGYWIAVFGIILSIIGVFVFLWGSTFTPGGEAYWAYPDDALFIVRP